MAVAAGTPGTGATEELVTAGVDGVVRTWDLETMKPSTRSFRLLSGYATSLAVVKRGRDRLLVTGDTDKNVRVWDLASGRQRGPTLTGHTGPVRAVAVGEREPVVVASASDDGTVRLWDLQTGRSRSAPLTAHTGAVTALAFAPAGDQLASDRLASGSDDGTVRIWNPSTGTQARPPLDVNSPVTQLAYYELDRSIHLVAGDEDGVLRNWRSVDWKLNGPIMIGHTGPVSALAVEGVPDRRRPGDPPPTVHSGSTDGTVRAWTTYDVAAWKVQLCGRAGRNLTAGEWAATELAATGPDLVPGVPMTTPREERSVMPEEAFSFSAFQARFEGLARNIESFIQGKPDLVKMALVCLFAEGHLLVEGVPGVAKTSLARAIARSISADVQRIQFTPDLLPSDVTGTVVPDLATGRFQLKRGPVFTNILIGDEINRATAKTQSALLEVMAERQVTIDRQSYQLDRPFLCVATQNPGDHLGTYDLPEAQLDRFTMRIALGYPVPADEVRIVQGGLSRRTPEELQPVLSTNDMLRMFATVCRVEVVEQLQRYIVGLTSATRRSTQLRLGASPRASIAVAICAQAYAAAEGRPFATADDVKAVGRFVLAHRLFLTPPARAKGATVEQVLDEVFASVEAPRVALA